MPTATIEKFDKISAHRTREGGLYYRFRGHNVEPSREHRAVIHREAFGPYTILIIPGYKPDELVSDIELQTPLGVMRVRAHTSDDERRFPKLAGLQANAIVERLSKRERHHEQILLF